MSSSDFLEDLVEKNIRIGNNAGQTDQGNFSIAIGNNAGKTDQDDNTIILNAKSQELNTDTSNAFYVKPIRNSEGTSLLQYDICSGEITHSNQISENLDLSCNLLNDVSGINFCDGTFIGKGNSFDISTSEVLKVNQDALVVDTSNNIGIGTTQPSCSLDISRTDAIQLPSGTTSQQPTNSLPGMIRYNSEVDSVEFYSSTNDDWIELSSQGITADGGSTTIKFENGEEYKVHSFTDVGSDTFEVFGSGTIDILAVAGGGGGGGGQGNYGGGGGAGGLIFIPSFLITTTGTINISIGNGGSGQSGTTQGDNGGDTTVNGLGINLLAKGGGGGGAQDGTTTGKDGGSGGGGGYPDPSSGSGGDGIQPNQSGNSGSPNGFGNKGGNGNGAANSGFENDANSGGGGGGAGEKGITGTSNEPSDGGDGLNEVTITSTLYNFANMFGTTNGDISFGEAYFAGGGGGSTQDTNAGGPSESAKGGLGGGGSGSYYNESTQTDGQDNTGGGGGAGTEAGSGRNGGSGIVIIRYKV
jgi:hypothetical protein